jgi:hypothetical protein
MSNASQNAEAFFNDPRWKSVTAELAEIRAVLDSIRPAGEALLKSPEVERLLNCGPTALSNWRKKGLIRATNRSGHYFYSPSEVRRFMEEKSLASSSSED